MVVRKKQAGLLGEHGGFILFTLPPIDLVDSSLLPLQHSSLPEAWSNQTLEYSKGYMLIVELPCNRHQVALVLGPS